MGGKTRLTLEGRPGTGARRAGLWPERCVWQQNLEILPDPELHHMFFSVSVMTKIKREENKPMKHAELLSHLP